MTLGNMGELGVHHLIAYCPDDACRHQALIDVSSYQPIPRSRGFRARSNAVSAAPAAGVSTSGQTGKRRRLT